MLGALGDTINGLVYPNTTPTTPTTLTTTTTQYNPSFKQQQTITPLKQPSPVASSQKPQQETPSQSLIPLMNKSMNNNGGDNMIISLRKENEEKDKLINELNIQLKEKEETWQSLLSDLQTRIESLNTENNMLKMKGKELETKIDQNSTELDIATQTMKEKVNEHSLISKSKEEELLLYKTMINKVIDDAIVKINGLFSSL